jgi:hypothetical protein
VREEEVDDEARALELVLQVRRVDEDELVVLHREVDVLLEHLELVARVAVEADFADAEDVGLRARNSGIIASTSRGEAEVLGLLRVDAEPGEMRQEKLRGARGSYS